MSKHKIEFDEKCKSCGGTGLYKGMGELGKVAVICHTCKGTGCHHQIFEYEDFTGRIHKENIVRVIETNPGIGSGDTKEFGGMTYEEWKLGKNFIRGMEMRRYTCPAWWYQCIDWHKKPKWDECIGVGSFSQCEHFTTKYKCWVKFDNEQS